MNTTLSQELSDALSEAGVFGAKITRPLLTKPRTLFVEVPCRVNMTYSVNQWNRSWIDGRASSMLSRKAQISRVVAFMLRQLGAVPRARTPEGICNHIYNQG